MVNSEWREAWTRPMKGADVSLLVAAINRVLDGGIYLSQRVSDSFWEGNDI